MENVYFRLAALAEGVYAAIAKPDATASSNAAIVDLGDRTVIVDAFMLPQPAEALAEAARNLTGREASLLLLTHSHQDHWGGASAFPEALYAATPAARTALLEDLDEYREWQANPSDVVSAVESIDASLRENPGEPLREALEARLRRSRMVLEQLPELRFRAPESTIVGELTLHGAKRTAVVRTIGHGHTQSDLYVELPNDGIVLCGDLAFFGTQPFMVDADPGGWIAWLQQMEESQFTVFVPGHGPVGGKCEISLLRRYIETLTARVREAESIDQALEISLPRPFSAWQAVEARRFELNVRALFGRLKG